MVDYGEVVPEGRLPVFSTKTEACARKLLISACDTNLMGEFIAAELVYSQNLNNLEDFSRRLDEVHDRMIASGSCACEEETHTTEEEE